MSIDNFYPSVLDTNKHNNKDTQITVINVVRKNDYYLQQLIKVSTIMKNIPKFAEICFPVLDHERLDIGEFNNYDINIMSKSHEYIIYTINDTKNALPLYDSLYNSQISRRYFLSTFINIYVDMCKNFEKINTQKLILLELHPTNIVFHNNLPKICSIERSIKYDNISFIDVESFFNNYEPNNVMMPIEYHIICYMISNSLEGLSSFNLEEVCNDVIGVRGLQSLKMLEVNSLETYKKQILHYYHTIVNKSKNEIINILFQYCDRWNNYSLTVLYIIFLRDLFKRPNEELFYKNLFLKSLNALLSKNILSVPSGRLLPEQNILEFTNILYKMKSNIFKELIYL